MTYSVHDNKYWDKVWGESNQLGSYSYLESRMERALDKLGFFIQNGMNFKNGERVLEAGCGDGLVLLALMRLVNIEGYGIDFSEVALKQARNLMKLEKNIFNFNLGNVNELPYDSNTFDKIISLGVIEHFKDPTESIKEMFRVLKPEGNLILMTPNKLSVGLIDRVIKEKLGKWPFGYQTEYSPTQLEKLLNHHGFKTNKKIVQLRRRLENDNRSFKIISIADQFINLVNKSWGFYSYVFATKEDNGNE